VVLRDGAPELVLGSAGSNRIRSAILQVIVGAVDLGLQAAEAVEAPRLHWENSVVYVEPGLDEAALEAAGFTLSRFRAQNLFFGGVQFVERNMESGAITGAGDPRRGGAAVSA
jgi:gamma-glutamyltranspeptidase/glutathione hydrolase